MKVFVSIWAVVLTTGLFIYSCGGSEVNSNTDESTDVVATGAELYMDNCVVCHGKDGKAGMSGATDLSTSVLSHANTVNVITNGRNGMRAFSSQFSKEEIEVLTKYVESLRK